MAHIQNITDENFKSAVLGSKKIFVVDFFSEWCHPCKTMSPIFKEIARQFDNRANFGKLDISANTQTPTNYRVLAIPTFIIFKEGKETKRLTGIISKDKFKTEIEKLL